ncbi:LysM peptidoglycan-binding domain-containing protein [Thermohalobacter berrensis]|uniref:Peptidoglycan-binding protein LysM n=1 Tax=Thermohalobacter berrensis TaxID=99594 RepID=A0A419SY17_9FIRM|nr:LysM peptidoglycan-binding domain-containing protein [Thermohalobacter berrensis]RKD30085.1 peptidoglycan-binding protein LysM [Thermohalobacter berrensis]
MKNKLKKIIVSTIAASLIGTSATAYAWTYEVKSGDTFWKISQRYGVSLDKLMESNNATENTILYVGQKLTIPDNNDYFYYEVKSGDTPYLISEKFGISLENLLSLNNLNQYSIIYPGDKLKIPASNKSTANITNSTPSTFIPEQPRTYITYKEHTVQPGDNFWTLSLKYGVPVKELLKVNNADTNTRLYVGDTVTIPVHNVPEMERAGEKYGEYLDWWNGAQYVIPIGATIKVIDFYTGKSFMAKRTTGASHADVEALTKEDTEKLKDIWGGNFSWVRRPVIVEYNGRKIAASASGMPHAGNDSDRGGYYTSWRSGDYGPGINLDYVKNNGMNGHFDIHFLNSQRHKDGKVDEKHQENVKIAAGIR